MKLKLAIATAVLWMGLSPAQAVTITTTSMVDLIDGGTTMRLMAINTVAVNNPEPYWANQPITFKTAVEDDGCEFLPGFNADRSFCCIGNGNFSRDVVTETFECPAEKDAVARSFGRIGGYGGLPYRAHDSLSPCESAYCDPCA